MDNKYIHPAVPINNFSKSIYGNKPVIHAYEHPDIVSVRVKDLFPDIPDAIYAHDGDDLSRVCLLYTSHSISVLKMRNFGVAFEWSGSKTRKNIGPFKL